MKIALYIEDGREQIVLTPSTDTEKGILNALTNGSVLTIHKGSFYGCRGGWTRHGESDDSTIIVLERESP